VPYQRVDRRAGDIATCYTEEKLGWKTECD